MYIIIWKKYLQSQLLLYHVRRLEFTCYMFQILGHEKLTVNSPLDLWVALGPHCW